jgi:hypothetical protein
MQYVLKREKKICVRSQALKLTSLTVRATIIFDQNYGYVYLNRVTLCLLLDSKYHLARVWTPKFNPL